MKTNLTQAQALAVPNVRQVAYNGTAWTAYEPGDTLPQPTLAQRQASKWEEIKDKRERLSDAGGYKVVVSTVDKWFHSDQKSKVQQISLKDLGASIPAGLQWKTMDGTFVTMTQALALSVFSAGVAQDQAIFQAAETHRTAMLAAANPDTYNFSTGWPAVFAGVS